MARLTPLADKLLVAQSRTHAQMHTHADTLRFSFSKFLPATDLFGPVCFGCVTLSHIINALSFNVKLPWWQQCSTCGSLYIQLSIK